MNMGDDISADFKWTEMCRVQSTLLMGERLISATVGSPEHTECNSRVQAVRGARQSGDSRQCHRQTEGERSIPVPVDGTVGRTYRRGASLSTHLSDPFANGSYPISTTFVVAAWLAQVQGGVLRTSQQGDWRYTGCDKVQSHLCL